MKNESSGPVVAAKLSDDDIRAYAFHLYEQSNCAPGHCLENWLEATACLNANIPAVSSNERLHWHMKNPATVALDAAPAATTPTVARPPLVSVDTKLPQKR